MSDLIERLRNKDWLWTVPGALREEAAAEIARLRSDLAVEKINNKRLQSERNNAEAEIARLQHDIERHIAICGNLATEIERLQRCIGQIEEDEIARLQELLRGT